MENQEARRERMRGMRVGMDASEGDMRYTHETSPLWESIVCESQRDGWRENEVSGRVFHWNVRVE